MSNVTAEDMTDSQQIVEPDFEARVNRICEMVAADPTVRDRMLAEIYIFISDFDRSMRTMAANGGPKAMLKAMLGGGMNG